MQLVCYKALRSMLRSGGQKAKPNFQYYKPPKQTQSHWLYAGQQASLLRWLFQDSLQTIV